MFFFPRYSKYRSSTVHFWNFHSYKWLLFIFLFGQNCLVDWLVKCKKIQFEMIQNPNAQNYDINYNNKRLNLCYTMFIKNLIHFPFNILIGNFFVFCTIFSNLCYHFTISSLMCNHVRYVLNVHRTWTT